MYDNTYKNMLIHNLTTLDSVTIIKDKLPIYPRDTEYSLITVKYNTNNIVKITINYHYLKSGQSGQSGQDDDSGQSGTSGQSETSGQSGTGYVKVFHNVIKPDLIQLFKNKDRTLKEQVLDMASASDDGVDDDDPYRSFIIGISSIIGYYWLISTSTSAELSDPIDPFQPYKVTYPYPSFSITDINDFTYRNLQYIFSLIHNSRLNNIGTLWIEQIDYFWDKYQHLFVNVIGSELDEMKSVYHAVHEFSTFLTDDNVDTDCRVISANQSISQINEILPTIFSQLNDTHVQVCRESKCICDMITATSSAALRLIVDGHDTHRLLMNHLGQEVVSNIKTITRKNIDRVDQAITSLDTTTATTIAKIKEVEQQTHTGFSQCVTDIKAIEQQTTTGFNMCITDIEDKVNVGVEHCQDEVNGMIACMYTHVDKIATDVKDNVHEHIMEAINQLAQYRFISILKEHEGTVRTKIVDHLAPVFDKFTSTIEDKMATNLATVNDRMAENLTTLNDKMAANLATVNDRHQEIVTSINKLVDDKVDKIVSKVIADLNIRKLVTDEMDTATSDKMGVMQKMTDSVKRLSDTVAVKSSKVDEHIDTLMGRCDQLDRSATTINDMVESIGNYDKLLLDIDTKIIGLQRQVSTAHITRAVDKITTDLIATNRKIHSLCLDLGIKM